MGTDNNEDKPKGFAQQIMADASDASVASASPFGTRTLTASQALREENTLSPDRQEQAVQQDSEQTDDENPNKDLSLIHI